MVGLIPSLRANGSRECAPDDRLREAIHRATKQVWIASSQALLAMTWLELRINPTTGSATAPGGRIDLDLAGQRLAAAAVAGAAHRGGAEIVEADGDAGVRIGGADGVGGIEHGTHQRRHERLGPGM